ncbi:MAG: tRNA (5-methylaminomethyl-2-thiouridine)(34)-methyltransferase MnmD [Bacteroidota bacterium]
MKRKIITTSDGSKTIQIEDWNEQYHSIHGALQEANHVFIKHGLLFFCSEFISESHEKSINVLEIGFGTGLNAFLTLIKAEELAIKINYTGVEAYPVSKEELTQLDYADFISPNHRFYFESMHHINWEKRLVISPVFSLLKQEKFFKDISDQNEFDLIYFDAFGARVQPGLWTESIFEKMFTALRDNGVLVTYSAKGSVRRAMEAVGFKVERLPGPPGKREMLRAQKMRA